MKLLPYLRCCWAIAVLDGCSCLAVRLDHATMCLVLCTKQYQCWLQESAGKFSLGLGQDV